MILTKNTALYLAISQPIVHNDFMLRSPSKKLLIDRAHVPSRFRAVPQHLQNLEQVDTVHWV